MNIAVLGSLTVDLFVRPAETRIISQISEHERSDFLAFPHGGKIGASEIQEQFGGGASNTAVSFARLGFSPCVFGAIGDEASAESILQNLQKNGISPGCVQKIPGVRSGFSVIINSFDGERTVIYTSGANTSFARVSPETLLKSDAIYLCHISGEHYGEIFQELATVLEKNPRPFFAWNPGKESLCLGLAGNAPLLSRTNLLFVNREEAELLVQQKSIPNESYGEKVRKGDLKGKKNQKSGLPAYAIQVSHLAQEILKMGVETVVITDGRRGSQIFTHGQKTFFFCPVDEEAARVDTLGAGDAFASTFTAHRLLKKPLPECALYATIRASSVVGKVGAQEGLTTTKTLQEQYQTSNLRVLEIPLEG
ncbi:MAG: carbohydrate kinase family protein [Candidatus Peregrinibacteria bacterium]